MKALVTSFLIDLVSSSHFVKKLYWDQRASFFETFTKQLEPHVSFLQLKHRIIKFTGDGWLLMSKESDDIAPLCCLALILQKRFREEINNRTDFPLEVIPRLRMAICSAVDLQVNPFGHEDWVFESAWAATRLAQYCDQPVNREDEILVNDCVARWLPDFEFEEVDLSKRTGPKKQLEQPIKALRLVKLHAAAGLNELPYAYTRLLLGQLKEADARRFLPRFARSNAQLANEFLHTWLRHYMPTYLTARICLELLIESGFKPDVKALTAVLSKSESYDQAVKDLGWMQSLGVEPNKFTYTTLITKCRRNQFGQAKQWFDKIKRDDRDTAAYTALMAKADLATASDLYQNLPFPPNWKTFSVLIRLAPSYEQGRNVFAEMKRKNVVPTLRNYVELVKTARHVSFSDASELLREIEEHGLMPDPILLNAILDKLKSREERNQWFAKIRDAGFEDTYTYNILLNHARDFESAEQLLGDMKALEIPRDVYSYNTLLTQLARSEFGPEDRLATCTQCLTDMEEDGVEPDIFTFNTVLRLTIDSARGTSQPAKIFQTIVDRRLVPNAFTFNQMIRTSANLEEASPWVIKLAASGERPDSYTFRFLLEKQRLRDTTPEKLLDWYLSLPVSGDDQFCEAAAGVYVAQQRNVLGGIDYGKKLRHLLEGRRAQVAGGPAT